MLRWTQAAKGYVTVKVWGYSVERLLNLCGNHDILVWDIEHQKDYTTMNISVKGFYELKPLLKKTGTRASIMRKCGLPFFLSRWGKRKIFLAGLTGCMIFWMLTSEFIWDIRIQGNYTLTEDVLMDYLKSQGIYVSMRQKNVQIEELEKSLRETYDVITWASVQLDGTTLLIFLKENEMPKYQTVQEENASGEQEQTSGSDLVAERDGSIAYIVTRKGVPQVMTGDAVEAGMVLVSGAVPVYNEDQTIRKYQFCDADADIRIRYTETRKLEESRIQEEKSYTGRKKRLPFLGLYEREIELGIGKIAYDTYDVEGEKKQIRLLERWYLPIYYGVRTVREYELIKCTCSEERMMEGLQKQWIKIIEGFDQKGVQIIEKNVTIKKNEKKWVLSAELLLEEPAFRREKSDTTQIRQEPETEEAVQE